MPAIGVTPFCNVNVNGVMVVGSIASLNVAVKLLPIGTPIAAVAGTVDVTVGRTGAGTPFTNIPGVVTEVDCSVTSVRAKARPIKLAPVLSITCFALRIFPLEYGSRSDYCSGGAANLPEDIARPRAARESYDRC